MGVRLRQVSLYLFGSFLFPLEVNARGSRRKKIDGFQKWANQSNRFSKSGTSVKPVFANRQTSQTGFGNSCCKGCKGVMMRNLRAVDPSTAC